MPIKKLCLGILLLFAISGYFSFTFSGYDLEFQAVKERICFGALKASFLKKMADLFQTDIFIETGTCHGSTLDNAKNYFKILYSVEKERHFYNKAIKKFERDLNINLFCEKSPKFLAEILPQISEKALFWLDAHCDEESTAILQEIEAIKKYYSQAPIILVDDILLFKISKNYPTVMELKEQLLSIRENYEFVLLFDAALAFPSELGLDISPVLKACTLSYLSEEGNEKAEKTISLCKGKEKSLILELHKIYPNVGKYHLWAGLIFLRNQKYDKARTCFANAIKNGCKNWKTQTYFSQYKQDEYIHKNFFREKHNGFFVEVGAHDGIGDSNTYFFEKFFGWNGLCIEPLPKAFEHLDKNRNCTCINACIASFDGVGKFLKILGYSEKLSGLLNFYDPKHLERINQEISQYKQSSEVIELPCFKLESILDQYNVKKINYLSLDTEGNELSILQTINFKKFDIDIISVENPYQNSEIKKLLEKNGYKFMAKLKCDDIYKKTEENK